MQAAIEKTSSHRSPRRSQRLKPHWDRVSARRSRRKGPRLRPASTTPPRRKTVLVVEDDQQIVEGLTVRLRAAGYNTLVASDGEEGVASAVLRRPNAIILDVLMPKMDGLTALNHLREKPETRHIPVMVISASVQDKRASLDAGARFFLTKPYQSQTMLQAVESITAENPDPPTR